MVAAVASLRDHDQGDEARPRPARRHRARSTRAARPRRTRTIDGEDIDRAIEIIRDRTDTLGVSEPEIARIGTDQIRVGLPDVQNAERAIDQVGDTAQLYFYDCEPNVIPTTRSVRTTATERPLHRALRRGQVRLRAEAGVLRGRRAPPPAPTLLPLRRRARCELLAGPGERRGGPLRRPARRRAAAEDSEIVDGPAGHVVVQRSRRATTRTTEVDESETAPPSTSCCATARSSRGDEIKDPKQSTDPNTNQPNVTFDFTDEGQRGVPGGHPGGSPSAGRRRPRPASPATAGGGAYSDHFAIVLDSEIVSRPIINFVREPGRDRRPHRRPDLAAASRSRRPRTWPSSCRSARCRST